MNEGSDQTTWPELICMGLTFLAIFGGFTVWQAVSSNAASWDIPFKVITLIIAVFGGIAMSKLISDRFRGQE